MYVAVGTQPDISYTVGKLAQFLDCYTQSHFDAVMHTLHYLFTTKDLKLRLSSKGPLSLIVFTDSSHGDCLDTRHSSMGYCFSLGSGVITWASRCQKTVAISTLEAEYLAVSEACRELLWINQLFRELNIPFSNLPILLCNNDGAHYTANDPTNHSCAKHIDICHHFIHTLVHDRELSIHHINTKENIADILTKPLLPEPFRHFCLLLGLS